MSLRRGELALVPCRNGIKTAELIKKHLLQICKKRKPLLKDNQDSYEIRQLEFIKFADIHGIDIISSRIKDYSDGEISICLDESVRGKDAYIIQNTLDPDKPEDTSKNIMELLLMIETVKRSSAAHITIILPYLSYSKQERRQGRQPISTKLLIDLMNSAGADKLVTMELHAPAIEGFSKAKEFQIENLFATSILLNDLMKTKKFDGVFVAPDPGAGKTVKHYSKATGLPMALGYKHRSPTSQHDFEEQRLLGDVKDKDVAIIDDQIATGGTTINIAKICKEAGAKKVYAAVTHGMFLKGAENFKEANEKDIITKVIVTNTLINNNGFYEKFPFIVELDAMKIFAESIYESQVDGSISSLYEDKLRKTMFGHNHKTIR